MSIPDVLGYVNGFLNTSSDRGVDIFYAEFHADFRSGLHFDLGGRTSEHKRFFRIPFLIRRYNLFRAIAQNIINVYAFFASHFDLSLIY